MHAGFKSEWYFVVEGVDGLDGTAALAVAVSGRLRRVVLEVPANNVEERPWPHAELRLPLAAFKLQDRHRARTHSPHYLNCLGELIDADIATERVSVEDRHLCRLP